MAKKEDKAENPQNKTGAPVPTGQEPPQDNTGGGHDGSAAGGRQAADPGRCCRQCRTRSENPDQKTRRKVSDAVQKVGKALLKSNPDMSVVYMTADGRGFYEKNDADNHARTLNNKAVTPVKR